MMGWLFPLMGTGLLMVMAGFASMKALEAVTSPLLDRPTSVTSSEPEATPVSKLQQMRRERPDQYYTAVLERPLFSPTRRPNLLNEPVEAPQKPVVVEVVEDVITAPEPPDLSLHGTMMSANGGPSALLSLGGETPEWTTTGTEIEGWKLNEIGNDWAVFKNGDESFRLEMY